MSSTLSTYYAARAGEYDQIYLKPERQQDLREMEAWLPEVFKARSVLEVACGTGYWTQFIATTCHRLLAIDAAPETLKVAISRGLPDRVVWQVGDAYHLPTSATPMDAGFAGFWWSHVPRGRLASFLTGFHAALAPASTVVLLDNRFVAGSSTPIASTDEEGNTYQDRPLADGSTHRILKNFPSEQEVLQAIAPHATHITYRTWPHYWAVAYVTAP